MKKIIQQLKTYWNYFKYIIEHKWNVGVECFKMGLYLHALTHDLSKFKPSEFFAYAEKFFSGDYAYKYFEVEDDFEMAWHHHYSNNKHHWKYWITAKVRDYDKEKIIIAFDMPIKYIKQMICDWKGMARKFGGTWITFYKKDRKNMILHKGTIKIINKFIKEKI